jgi:DNA-binding response OmpR family regulator
MEQTAVIVEDEADIAELIGVVLTSCGYTVHAATNGLAAVELIREVDPDLITMDVGIPGIDGLEVARRVRGFSDAYIIFVSALVEPADADRAQAAGGDEYLGKPFRPRDLRARVSALPATRRGAEAKWSTAPDISGLERRTDSAGLEEENR